MMPEPYQIRFRRVRLKIAFNFVMISILNWKSIDPRGACFSIRSAAIDLTNPNWMISQKIHFSFPFRDRIENSRWD
jgi:hypothetical protein